MKPEDREVLPWGAVIALFPLLWVLTFIAMKVVLPAIPFAMVLSGLVALALVVLISSQAQTRRLAIKAWDFLTALV